MNYREGSIRIESRPVLSRPVKLQDTRVLKRWRGKKFVIRVPLTVEDKVYKMVADRLKNEIDAKILQTILGQEVLNNDEGS